MLLEVIVDNKEDIKDLLDYEVKNPTIYNELITNNFVKVYLAHRLFYNTENETFFKCTNDYIFIEEIIEESLIETEYKDYTISRNIKSVDKNISKWRCINLAFDSLIFLNTEDITHKDFVEFMSNVNKKLPNIKPIDILYIFIVNTALNIINDSSEVYNLITEDLASTVDIIFNISKIKPSEQRSKLLDLADELVKLYKINERKLKVEQSLLLRYDNIVNIFQEIDPKCTIKSEKVDTHLDITTNILSNFDVFEIFNKFVPNSEIPYMHISDFNKIKNEYQLPEDWLEDLTTLVPTNDITFYIMNEDDEPEVNKVKPMSKFYSKCSIKEIKKVEDKFELQIVIEIERSKIKDESDRNKLIVKLLQNIPFITDQKKVVVEENVAKGYILYNLRKNMNYVDIPIFRHYFLLDDFVNYFFSLEQQYTIERTRGGESLYFYRNYITEALVQPVLNYDILYKNIDGKCNLLYDKIGRDSKTRIKFPVDFISSKGNLPDVLIVKYSKLNLDVNIFKKIVDKLMCYMSDSTNLQLVKSAYENCL